MSNPDLKFGRSDSAVGFTSVSASTFADLNATRLVRELIQNSLDAALTESNEKCARVRFRKFKCHTKDIPGIESYRKAFNQAKLTHTQSGKQKLPGQAKQVVDRIQGTLKDKTQTVLSVTDNGVGLNNSRMSALLSDGVSAKSGNAAGTWGNGHTVAIPASNLRYVLYGGLTDDGEKLASGQTLLASHKKPKKKNRSNHGVFIESWNSTEDDSLYTFPSGTTIPTLIDAELEKISNEHGHGSAIIIPAFNQFEEDDRSLWEIVSHSAACNFFQAIHSEQLIVEVEDSVLAGRNSEKSSRKILNKETLPDILNEHKGEKRIRRRGAFLSGLKAYQAYQALLQGISTTVDTPQGGVQIILHIADEGKQRVGLCRNGMWITEDLPRFQNQFHDRQPFQALILLEPKRRNGFYRLIQSAETPMHNNLELKQMPNKSRHQLIQALVKIRDWIRETVPEIISESYSPDDVLAFQFNETETKGGPRGNKRSFWGSPATTAVRPPQTSSGTRSDTSSGNGSGRGKGGSNNGSRSGGKDKNSPRAIPYFRVVSTPAGPDRQKILIDCRQECENAELRIFVDENIDATCDRQPYSQITPLLLSDVLIGGEKISTQNLIRSGRGYNGIKLGNLQAETELIVETGLKIPEEILSVIPGNAPALRVQIDSREAKKESTTEERNKPGEEDNA